MQLPDFIPDRIRNRITIVDNGDHRGPCWMVSGWDDGKGHKKIRWGGVCTFVHRVVLALHLKREVKELDTVDHLCRYEPCCNPAHLENVTVKVNTDRGDGKQNQFRPAESYSREPYDWREPLDRLYAD